MTPSRVRCWAVLILSFAAILATLTAEGPAVGSNVPHSAALPPGSVATESSSSLVYSTYLGGAKSNDLIHGLAVDAAGNAYVTGFAGSTDFPVTPGAYNTTPPGGFVAKLNPAGGSLLYSTLGLASPDAVSIDSAGNAYVTGVADAGFPTTPGALNSTGPGVFVAKVSPAGDTLLYSTFIGDGYARAIALTASGEVVVVGSTDSKWFPTTPGAYSRAYNPGCSLSNSYLCHDGFVAKLNAFGTALVFSTFLGGSGDDTVTSVALDSAQNVYLAGYTLSKDFPTTPGAYNRTPPGSLNVMDAFVAKLNAAGSQLLYATFLGGSDGATVSGLTVDAAGGAVVVGETSSVDFPTTPNRLNRTLKASDPYRIDGFVSKLSPSGSSLLYSTFIGGSRSDSTSAVAIDASQQIVVAGETASPDFPVTPGAPDAVYGGGMCGIGPDPCFDAFVSVINETPNGLVYSTFLGGNKDDGASGLALGPGGVFVAGTANSMNFPVTPGAFQTTGGGTTRFNSSDGFVAALAYPGSGGSTSYGIHVTSSPSALQIAIDGTSFRTPLDFVCATGSVHTLNALSPQVLAGKAYAFVSWSDGGASAHSFPCDRSTTFGATYAAQTSPDFLVAVSPGHAIALAGGSASFNVSVSALGGYASPPVTVSLVGSPAGIAGSCSPASVTPNGTCLLVVNVALSVPVGTYPLSFEGRNGSVVRIAYASLQVLSTGDFYLALAPTSVTLSPGGTAQVNITVARLGGVVGNVTLAVSSESSVVGASVSPAVVAPGGRATLTLVASLSLKSGTFNVTVRGVAGSTEHDALLRILSQSGVPSPPPGASPNSLPIIVGLPIALVVALAAWFLWRRRKR
jgi:LPXTG-motif cell wall-anchored protein